jgi:hypothetical protein
LLSKKQKQIRSLHDILALDKKRWVPEFCAEFQSLRNFSSLQPIFNLQFLSGDQHHQIIRVQLEKQKRKEKKKKIEEE